MVQTVVSAAPGSPGFKPAEIWFADQGIVTYDSIPDMLAAVDAARTENKTIFSTYVYDFPTGLKLFGKAAFMVHGKGGEVVAFLKKADADSYVQAHGGALPAASDSLASLP
jgi:NitT/TauT family transport system substrate-binding protein